MRYPASARLARLWTVFLMPPLMAVGCHGTGAQDSQGADAGWAQLSLGLWHTCGLDSDGQAYCWGDNDDGELGDGTTTQRTDAVRIER